MLLAVRIRSRPGRVVLTISPDFVGHNFMVHNDVNTSRSTWTRKWLDTSSASLLRPELSAVTVPG